MQKSISKKVVNIEIKRYEIMKTVFVDLDNTLALNETCDDVPYTKGLYL